MARVAVEARRLVRDVDCIQTHCIPGGCLVDMQLLPGFSIVVSRDSLASVGSAGVAYEGPDTVTGPLCIFYLEESGGERPKVIASRASDIDAVSRWATVT
jgi:hypothetical protein